LVSQAISVSKTGPAEFKQIGTQFEHFSTEFPSKYVCLPAKMCDFALLSGAMT
jgi:hypothetical protein